MGHSGETGPKRVPRVIPDELIRIKTLNFLNYRYTDFSNVPFQSVETKIRLRGDS